ncbi:hypothetical protein NON20_18380 [Synechocystis sp. B12]|nr:hypothetical protein NON20_18380 [Synechocystis sp. B12]
MLEECTLLGQALSCDWLEEAGNRLRGELVRPQVDLLTLLPTAIAELRSLREQFLAGELTPQRRKLLRNRIPNHYQRLSQ